MQSLVRLQGVRGELINVGLAQRVGELATAWVGGPGRTRGCARCGGACDLGAQLGGLGSGREAGGLEGAGGAMGGVLRGGCWRAPRSLRLVPGKFWSPTYRARTRTPLALPDSPSAYSFRPELISSLPAA